MAIIPRPPRLPVLITAGVFDCSRLFPLVASVSIGTNDTNVSADADGDSNGGSVGGVGGASTLDVGKLLGNEAQADDTAIQEVFSLKQINIMIKCAALLRCPRAC